MLQKRMIDALKAIAGLQSVGLVSQIPLGGGGITQTSLPAKRQTSDQRMLLPLVLRGSRYLLNTSRRRHIITGGQGSLLT